jgi:hypothetical protein
MSAAWFVILPVALIALLLVLKAVRDVGRNVGKLVTSMEELRDVSVGLSQLRDDLAARRAAGDDTPPQ